MLTLFEENIKNDIFLSNIFFISSEKRNDLNPQSQPKVNFSFYYISKVVSSFRFLVSAAN